jgi:hypothetical protein
MEWNERKAFVDYILLQTTARYTDQLSNKMLKFNNKGTRS